MTTSSEMRSQLIQARTLDLVGPTRVPSVQRKVHCIDDILA
jgi:hypothetical protein